MSMCNRFRAKVGLVDISTNRAFFQPVESTGSTFKLLKYTFNYTENLIRMLYCSIFNYFGAVHS